MLHRPWLSPAVFALVLVAGWRIGRKYISRESGRTGMPVGTVKWFDSKKGFGFVLSPEGKDVFVHFSSIQADGFRSLREGEQVEYEQIEGEKGLLAKDVKRLNPPT